MKKTPKQKQNKNPTVYRHVSFYYALLYCTSQIMHLLQIEGKTSSSKKITTCFIPIRTLLRWSGNEPTTSPKYAYITVKKSTSLCRSLKPWIPEHACPGYMTLTRSLTLLGHRTSSHVQRYSVHTQYT